MAELQSRLMRKARGNFLLRGAEVLVGDRSLIFRWQHRLEFPIDADFVKRAEERCQGAREQTSPWTGRFIDGRTPGNVPIDGVAVRRARGATNLIEVIRD